MSKKASEICDSYVIGNVNIKYTAFAREHLVSNVSKKVVVNKLFAAV